MKKMFIQYLCSDEQGECTVFMDEELNVLSVVHDNDGNWRHEYFNGVFLKMGIEISDDSGLSEEELEEKIKQQ